jgi:predicted transglutaminase-like cysteine proteinase
VSTSTSFNSFPTDENSEHEHEHDTEEEDEADWFASAITVVAKRSATTAQGIPIALTAAVVATPISAERFAVWYAENCNDHIHEVEAIALTNPNWAYTAGGHDGVAAVDDFIDRQMAAWEEIVSSANNSTTQVPPV